LSTGEFHERPLRAPRANHVFGTDEKRIRTENMVMGKSNHDLGSRFIQDRRLCADVLFIRAQSAIRADGAPSAQVRSLQFEASTYIRRGWRAAISC
jgi:hypothetical protein